MQVVGTADQIAGPLTGHGAAQHGSPLHVAGLQHGAQAGSLTGARPGPGPIRRRSATRWPGYRPRFWRQNYRQLQLQYGDRRGPSSAAHAREENVMGTVEGAAPGAPGRASAATGPRTCIRSFRASPDQVREARRFLAQVLGDCPTAMDAVACLSELVTNSVLYSNSRRPKGRFIVRACLRPAGVRVEVEDEGGPWKHQRGRARPARPRPGHRRSAVHRLVGIPRRNQPHRLVRDRREWPTSLKRPLNLHPAIATTRPITDLRHDHVRFRAFGRDEKSP